MISQKPDFKRNTRIHPLNYPLNIIEIPAFISLSKKQTNLSVTKQNLKNKSMAKYLLFFFIPCLGYSQLELSGTVKDSIHPIEFANVAITNQNNEIVAGTTTKEDGSFILQIRKGDYKLTISFLGYESWNKTIQIQETKSLGNIFLKKDQTHLAEVIVTGKKKLIERKIDRLVFNTESFGGIQGGDGLELLNVTPGILVTNDQIQMIGKSGMSLMVDGRIVRIPSDQITTYLKSIRSEDIKSVEVITNPSAKYDAEGNSGIVNLVLKKGKNNSWNSTIHSNYRQGEYAQGAIGGSFNYNKNKLSFYLSNNYYTGNYGGEENGIITYPIVEWSQKDDLKFTTDFFSNRLGLDYNINKKWSVGLQFNGNYSKPKSKNASVTNITENTLDRGTINAISTNKTSSELNSFNVHSTIVPDTLGRKINIDFDILSYKTLDDRISSSITSNSDIIDIPNQQSKNNNLVDRDIINYSGQIDIEHPFKKTEFNYGAKLTKTKTENDIKDYDILGVSPILNMNATDLYVFNEQNIAFYVSSFKEISKKWQAKLGLRLEHTITKGTSITLNEINKNSYTELFPTFYLKYQSNEKHQFLFDYGRRIYRPSFRELNPFRYYTNSLTYYSGNPNLLPTLTSNAELSYVYKDFLQSTIYASIDDNNSGQLTTLDNNTFEQAITRQNYFDSYNIGIKQVYVYNKLNWLFSLISASVFYNYSQSKVFPITPKNNSSIGAFINTSNTIYFNSDKTTSSGFNLSYRVPYKSNDLVDNRKQLYMSTFLKTLCYDKRLQITLTANNIFREYSFNNSGVRDGNNTSYNGYYDTQYIRLALSYSFGKKNLNVKQQKLSNEDEKNRI